MVDRKKGGNRGRMVNLRAIKSPSDSGKTEGPVQEIVGIGLGDRMVFSEQAEVWTVRGFLRDGTVARENVGELSFVLIPGTAEPAAAVVGFISPPPPYALALNEDQLWPMLRAIVVQLSYDLDGFYASIAVGGKYAYYEEYRLDR